MAIFEMSNGVVFNYRGRWCAEGLNTPWECTWRAVGEKGTALWDGGTLPNIFLDNRVIRDILSKTACREKTSH